MPHIDENLLLQYALETLDEPERAEVADHLAQCPECLARLQEARDHVSVMGSVAPQVTPIPMPQQEKRRGIMMPLLRTAAVFVFGVFVGWIVSNVTPRESISVTPSYLAVQAPSDTAELFAPVDATALPTGYYQRLR